MNKSFANYTTSLAFNMSLSKNMVIALAAIAGYADRYDKKTYIALGSYDTAVTSARCLKDRGLVYSYDPEKPGLYKLTKAGELVIELLKEAGLIEVIQAANETKAA